MRDRSIIRFLRALRILRSCRRKGTSSIDVGTLILNFFEPEFPFEI
jgi:hypothetical protein